MCEVLLAAGMAGDCGKTVQVRQLYITQHAVSAQCVVLYVYVCVLSVCVLCLYVWMGVGREDG